MTTQNDQTSLFGTSPEEEQETDTAAQKAGQTAGKAAAQPARLVDVLVPYPVEKAYSYAVPAELDIQEGNYVTVPLGSRDVIGVVWNTETQVPPQNATGTAKRKPKIKEIIHRMDDMPSMPREHRNFIDWVARYTLTPKGFVLKMALSVSSAFNPPAPVTAYQKAANISEETRNGLSDKRKAVLHALRDNVPRRAAELADMAGCTTSVIKGMEKLGLLETIALHAMPPCHSPQTDTERVTLSDFQQAAADNLCMMLDEREYCAALLDGVTGAGKTEVYFEAVAKALDMGKQVLILLPEIALSNAFLDRFKSRFGCAPALWHSSLSPAKRRDTWRGVAEGKSRVIIGARSALFLPYHDLGLIIVDEEHDPAYKQEDGVIYHARDMAVVRANLGKFPLVLVSATPSLETMINTWSGRYHHLHLPHRHGAAQLPEIELLDMRAHKPPQNYFLSEPLIAALKDNIEHGNQSLLFLNRRGYAPLTICRGCGHRLACPRCTAWLVEHKQSNRLHCHHCGYNTPTPKQCPECGDPENLAACGPGVERIFEEVTELIPEARSVILASDTTESHEELAERLNDIKAGAYDIIIGTQIIAKGHHFPHLTLVGVVDADLGLQGGDLRAAERTYQLLHQVAGRAGREEKEGHVMLQTWHPDNKVMQALAAHERDFFYEVEGEEREMAHMPPFSRLVGIIVSGKDEQQVLDISIALGRSAPQGEKVQTLGPADAPFYRLRGFYRRRLLVRADKKVDIQKTVQSWIKSIKVPSTVRIYIDIDPQSFL